MSDEEISKLTVSQIIDLIKRLMDEIEIRAMQSADNSVKENFKCAKN